MWNEIKTKTKKKIEESNPINFDQIIASVHDKGVTMRALLLSLSICLSVFFKSVFSSSSLACRKQRQIECVRISCDSIMYRYIGSDLTDTTRITEYPISICVYFMQIRNDVKWYLPLYFADVYWPKLMLSPKHRPTHSSQHEHVYAH